MTTLEEVKPKPSSIAHRLIASFPVRRLSFDFTSSKRYWFDNDAYFTHLMNAMSAIFPQGELMLIKALRNIRDKIDDPVLQAEISAFIGQEAMHAKEHLAFNRYADEQQININDLQNEVKALYALMQKILTSMHNLLINCVPNIEHLTAQVLDETRPGIVPLREMLRQSVDDKFDFTNMDFAERFAKSALELLVLSLEVQDIAKVNIERDLYSKAMSFILRNLQNPELNLEKIAQAHCVSTRTLSRAFARHQKTVMSVIWCERLIASRDALKSGRVASISEVALDYGFTDFSHFSHAFKKAFGVTPREYFKKC